MSPALKNSMIVIFFGINIFLTLFGFMSLYHSPYTGIRLDVCEDAACVKSVDKDSPAYLKINPGDRLIAVGEKAISFLAFNPSPRYIRSRKDHLIFWAAQQKLSEVITNGKPVNLLVERSGDRLPVVLTPVSFPFYRSLARTAPLYLAGWTFMGIAYLVLIRKDHEISIANFIIGAFACMCFVGFAPFTLRDVFLPVGPFRMLAYISYLGAQGVSYAALHLILIFPHRKKILLKHPGLIYVPYALLMVIVILHVTEAFDNTYVTTFMSMNVCLASVFGRLLYDYFNEKNPIFKKQVQWVVFGIITGVTSWLGMTSLPIVFGASFVSQELSVLPTVIYPISFAFAVTKYRLMDIESIFDAAVIYGATIVILEGVELALLGVVSNYAVVAQRTPYLSLIGVLMIVFLYVPLRNKVKNGVERLFKRGKYDVEKETRQFIARLGLRDGASPLEKFSLFIEELLGPSGLCIMKFEGDRASAYFLEGEKADQIAGTLERAGAKARAYFRDRAPCAFGYELADSGLLNGAGPDIENSLFVFMPGGEDAAYLAVLLSKWNKTAYSNKDRNLLRAISAQISTILDTEQRHASITKITPPGATTGIIRRERLFETLGALKNYPIIWVTSPAGSGKSTMASSWIASRKIPSLWYNVDEGDGDIATFFYYMGLAAKRADAGKRKPLPLLSSEYQGGIPVFTKRWFDDLYSRLVPQASRPLPHATPLTPDSAVRGQAPHKFVIVFDDYQDLPAGSVFHEMIVHGLEVVPEGMQIIILSRSEPPATFARLIANGSVRFLGWDDIKLTRDEAYAIARMKAREYIQLEIPSTTLDRLHEMSGGWAAGLILMLDHKKFKDADFPSDKALAPEEIFTYFASEIFDRMDRETRDFLLKTCFLPEMTAESAERLTNTGASWQRLYHLSKNYYFIERHSGEKTVYRYHPLFRDFLTTLAKKTISPGELANIRRSSVALLEESGRIADAAKLLHEASDWEDLVRLILTHAQALMAQGRSGTLHEWLAAVPAELARGNPWLLYWLGICSMPYDLTKSRDALEQAYALFTPQHDAGGLYLSWSAIVETFVYEWRDFTPLDHWITEFEMLSRAHPGFPSPLIEARVTSAIFCALLYRQPGHPDLLLWEERIKTIILASDDIQLKMIMSSHVILYNSWWTGEQAKAAFLIDTLRSSVESAPSDPDPLAIIVWRALEAAYLWIVAEKDACLAAVRQGLEKAERSGVHLWDFMLYAQAGLATVSMGDLDAAADHRQRMEFILTTNRRVDICHYYYQMAWGALCGNNLSLALEHAKTSYQIAGETGAPFMRAYTSLAMAAVLIECNRLDEADPYLREALQISSATSIKTAEYIYLSLEATRRFRQGDRGAALDSLRKHLSIGKACGIFNNGYWRASVMGWLYAKALEARIEVEFVQGLIKKRGIVPDGSSVYIEAWPWPVKIRTLGRFELLVDDQHVAFSAKAQKKPLELLKAVISFGGEDVSEDQLTGVLWPDSEGDAAHSAFTTTLSRLRQLLGKEKAIHVYDKNVTLDPRYCWVDVRAFEYLFDRVEEMTGRHGDPSTSSGQAQERRRKGVFPIPPVTESPYHHLLEKIFKLYRGGYLPSDAGHPWTVSMRERLRNKFLKLINRAGGVYEQAGQWEQAIACYQKAMDIDELSEEIAQRLMTCLLRLGRHDEAITTYRRCKSSLLATFGITQSAKTEGLYQTALRKTN